MSDYVPPSAYDGDPMIEYDYRFRVLIMHLFMDDLEIEQIEKYWFVDDLPERLKDDPNKVRSETLTYVKHEGMLEEWAEKPRLLRRILEDIGRMDLSTKVQKLVDKHRGFPHVQTGTYFGGENISWEQPSSSTKSSNHPIQETQTREDKTNQASAIDIGSKLEVWNEDYTVNSLGISSVVVRRTDQKRGKTRLRTSSKSVQTENPESTSRQVEALDLEFRSRSSSNASTRSSGYFSIRGSDPRLSRFSIPEIVIEESESNEESPSQQLHSAAIEEDEGVMDPNYCTEHFVSTHQNVGGMDREAESIAEANQPSELSDIQPINRPRSIQVSKSSQPHRNPNKDKSSDRSQTLPCNSRYVQGAATASSCTNLDSMSSSDSSSSSSSFDSDDTLTSPSTERRCSPLKPYPVVSRVKISGSMKIKVEEILKSAKKNSQATMISEENSQATMISEEFPPPNGYEGPRYEMRFYSSDYSKEWASLYIHVAPSYLSSKQQSTVEIPAMDITVTLSYDGESVRGWSSIKTVTDRTVKRKIDSENRSQMTTQIASFPHLLSYAELKLNKLKGQELVVSVNMNVY